MDQNNQHIIEQAYKYFAEGNMAGVLSSFSKDIVWIRPGAPFIPFAGTFNGLDEVIKMFAIQNETIKIKSFVPEKICTNENTVVVLGHDEAEVIETGKSYTSDWVQAFTLENQKIIFVRVFMDTKLIADAFVK
jgi:ketosteroid isomerase-like protein